MSDIFFKQMYELGFRKSPNKVKCGKVTYQDGWVCVKQYGESYVDCRVVMCEKPAKKFRHVANVGMALGVHWISAGLRIKHNLYAYGDDTQTMASMLRRELVRLNSVDQIAVREILGITFPQMVRFAQLAEVTEN